MQPVLPGRHRSSRSSDGGVSSIYTPLSRPEKLLPVRFLRPGRSSAESSARRHPSPVSTIEKDSKGFRGLNTVYQPVGDECPTGDLIFIHGLGGDAEKTWSKNGTFWPRDLLPNEKPFETTAIHSFGYNSNFKESSILNIEDFSNALLLAMLHHPAIHSSKSPIILVAHSMGGLIIKKAYILAKKISSFHQLAERIKAMCFVATPHTGSSLAPVLDKVFRLSSGLKPYLEDLKENSETVQSINSEFPGVSADLRIYSFFETSPLSLGGLRKVIVVPKDDAILKYPNEQTQMLYGDHRSICKYESPHDHNFITIWQTLAACVRELCSEKKTTDHPGSSDDEGSHFLQIIRDALGVQEHPADELLRVTTDRLPGTCQWLITTDVYEQWRTSLSPKILWLRGTPGTGKSYLAGSVIEHLQQQSKKCCYYFFNHTDKTRSSLRSFVLSLTWQMASTYREVRDRILQICQKDVDIGKPGDYRVLQRKFWEQGLFLTELQDEVFWVIDAFDECDSGQELAKLLVRVQEKSRGKIRIFVTTRHMFQDYHIVQDGVLSRDINVEDVQADIAHYLDTFKHEIPTSDPLERELLVSKILEKANGCFLWATLVLQRLGRAIGSQGRLRALEELQPGMDQLYSRIVDSMSQEDREISMIILTWVVCAVRPLTPAELKSVLEDATMDEIEDVGLVISRHCHGLLFIDRDSKIRMRHASTRNFFLREDINSQFNESLTIQEAEAHKVLAMTCLGYLNGPEMKTKPKRKVVASVEPPRSVFVNYACTALPEHVIRSQCIDNEIACALTTFLQTNVLSWIEQLANQGELETVLQFAQVLKSFLRRNSCVELLLKDDIAFIDSWADDLTRITSRFGRKVLMHPESVLNIVPALCPAGSLIFKQFARSPGTIVSLVGLSKEDWDDCLCTAVLSNPDQPYGQPVVRERLRSLAAAGEQFSIGTSSGRVAIFNEGTCVESATLDHGQHVNSVQYAVSKPLLATASRKMIKIWNTETLQPEWTYTPTSSCLAMTFVDDDRMLLVVLSTNTLLAMNLVDHSVVETHWEDMLDEPHRNIYHGSVPEFVSFNTDLGLLALAYRYRRLLVYNYETESYQVFHHRDGRSEDPTQNYAISIYALEFSRLPNTSLLAVSYSSSDLVLFDTEAGLICTSATKSYYSRLVSSPDGRTLAAATRNGTIELYDFETLHKLYQIRSDGGGVSVMQFTASSTSLLVIRAGGHDCRVWSPTVLYRRNVERTSISSPSLSPSSLDGVSDEPEAAVNHVTAVAVALSGTFFFVGKGSGSVSIYDAKTGLAISVLYSHQSPVKILHHSTKGPLQILFSADSNHVLMAHRIIRDKADWVAEPLYTYKGRSGILQQVLGGLETSRVLLNYADHAILLETETGTPITSTPDTSPSLQGGAMCHWTQDAKDSSSLLRFQDSMATLYSWSNLEPAVPDGTGVNLSGLENSETRIHRVMPISAGRNTLLLITLIHSPYGPRGPFSHRCFEASDLDVSEPAVAAPKPSTELVCSVIDVALGTYRERLVFLHKDGWICSIKATSLRDATEAGLEAVVHHFAPPLDWLLASKMLMQLTRMGDVLFVVRGDAVVLKRGLERSAEIAKGR